MGNTIFNVSPEKQREIYFKKNDDRTWEEKMINEIYNSPIVDENHFYSESGSPFILGDRVLSVFLKLDDSTYKSTKIKASELGFIPQNIKDQIDDSYVLYELVEDNFSTLGHIVIKQKNDK